MGSASIVTPAELTGTAVVLGAVLEFDAIALHVTPEVRNRRDCLATTAAVRARQALDVVVGVGAIIGGRRLATVDQQRVVGERRVHKVVAHVTVVEAVAVLGARLAEVGQLVEFVTPSQTCTVVRSPT